MSNFLKRNRLVSLFFQCTQDISKVNLNKFAVNLSLPIERIDFICLTLKMFNFKVNVFCRVNLVFRHSLPPSKTRHCELFLEARRVMFYEVRIFDAKGELKKVLSPKKLSTRFWKDGEQKLIDFTDKESSSSNTANKVFEKDEFQLEDR